MGRKELFFLEEYPEDNYGEYRHDRIDNVKQC